MREKIETARKCISEAYERVYALRVSGDDALRVVQAMGLLKEAFSALEQTAEKKEKTE